jgi:hypothetical protein
MAAIADPVEEELTAAGPIPLAQLEVLLYLELL